MASTSAAWRSNTERKSALAWTSWGSFRAAPARPLRPSWSFGYEVVVRAQKRFHERVARLSPADERRAWAALRANGPALSKVTRSSSTLGSVETSTLVPRDLPRPERVVLYLHGGSFIYGSESSHGELCARLALAARARVVFPLYRLALLIALRDAGDALPAAAVLISPWLDLTTTDGSMQTNEPFDWASPWMFERWTREYVQGGDATNPRVSPAFADPKGLPPLLIQVGTAELLHDQVLAFARRARAAGVEVRLEEFPDLVHLWHSLAPLFPRFQEGMDRIGEFAAKYR